MTQRDQAFEYEGCHECWFCKFDQLSGYPVCVFPEDGSDDIVNNYVTKTAPIDCPLREGGGAVFRLKEGA